MYTIQNTMYLSNHAVMSITSLGMLRMCKPPPLLKAGQSHRKQMLSNRFTT